MTISFSGLASGLDTDSWVEALVSVKQLSVTSLQTQLSTLETLQDTVSSLKSSFSTLQTALQTLTDSLYSSSSDVFAANTVTISDENLFSATVTTAASRDSYDISVDQLATSTVATSAEAASEVADGSTLLSDLGVTEGTFTLYIDGEKTTINIESDYTVANLQSLLSQAGATLDIDSDTGILSITATSSSSEIKISANTDTSNFVSLLGLEELEDGGYASTSSVYKVNGSTLITSDTSGFTTQINAGTFTIGDVEFTIDETTTLDNLISEINNSDAGVYASWDSTTGKLILESTVTGASFINVEAGTSNFTDVMGLTSSEWDTDGNVTSTRLLTSTQVLGDNAKVTINGTQVTSTSNTITSDISKITGLTLKLTGVSTEETGTSTLTVSQDTSAVTDALTDIVDAYNSLMSDLDDLLSTTGDLHGDTTLNSIFKSLRSTMTSSSSNSGIYTLLSQIGISTAAASSSLASDTISLTIDEDALAEALEADSDSVKELLIGTNGILSTLKTTVDSALSTGGYFTTKTSSISTQISNMESKITKKQNSVDAYETRLKNKFANMETIISNLNSSYSSILS